MPRQEFDWQIGEEKGQARPPGEDRQVNRPAWDNAKIGEDAARPRRSYWRVVLIVFTAAGLVAATVFLLVSRRANEITASVTQDVLAAHKVVQRAIAQSDTELFDTLVLQLGGDAGWHSVQRDLVQRAMLFDRRPFGLHLQAAVPQVVQVNLSPDLKEAEVVTEYAYTMAAGPGTTETVRLRHTAVYRFDRQRWLLAPPGGYDFWGDSLTSKGERLVLAYPERDAPIGERLARDLDAALAQLCADSPSIECPTGFYVQLRLSTAPDHLRSGYPLIFRSSITDTAFIEMPTPTLVGLPVDEAGYRALYRGYVREVAQAATSAYSAGSHLHGMLGDAGETAQAAISADRDPGPPPIPFPVQDIALYCSEGSKQGGSLFRYSLSTGTWSPELSSRSLFSMTPLPNGDGIILQERYRSAGRIASHLILWQDKQERTLFDDPSRFAQTHWWNVFDPTGRRLAIFLSGEKNGLLHLDRCAAAGCDVTPLPGFPAWSPDGSRVVLMGMFGDNGDRYYRSDGDGESMIEIPIDDDTSSLRSPFWLNNETYGYARNGRLGTAAESETPYTPSEIVVASIANDRPRVLLTSDDLLAMLPTDDRPERLEIGFFATVHPRHPNLLFISAYGLNPDSETTLVASGYVFIYDLGSQQVLSSIWTGGNVLWMPQFSPDGRWLTQSAYDPARSKLSLVLHHIGRNENKTLEYTDVSLASFGFPVYQWSGNGRWLLFLDDGILRLIAPDYDYERAIVPESPGCMFAAWIN
jgi:hypothetical protein